MKIFALTVILCASLGGIGSDVRCQDKATDQEIALLVSQLSWDSVGGECNLVWRIFPQGTAATKLIQIGKPSTNELLKVLNDEQKGVAAHLILVAIWEPENVSYENRVEGNEIDAADFIHVNNGLKWADVINFKNPSVGHRVDIADLNHNSEKWHRKLASLN